MASLVDSAPRIARVDAAAGALLINVLQKGGKDKFLWEFQDPSRVGFLIGNLLCPPHLELRWSESCGVGVFARQFISKGVEVLREEPIMRVDWSALPRGALIACDSVATRAAKLLDHRLKQMVSEATFVPAVAWCRETPSVRAEILALHCPDLTSNEKVPMALVDAISFGVTELMKEGWLRLIDHPGKEDSFQSQAPTIDADVIKNLVRVCFIALSTFFDCSDEAFFSGEYLLSGKGSGLRMGALRLISRINHSCLPNCWWHFEGSAVVVRSLVDIEANDEVSHCYFEEERWRPRLQRNSALASKFFRCDCQRCNVEGLDKMTGQGDEMADKDFTLSHLSAATPSTEPAKLLSRDPVAVVAYCQANWDNLTSENFIALEHSFIETNKLALQQARKICREEPSVSVLRPAMLSLLADFHDLFADLHRMSRLWRGCAMHIRARLLLMRQLFPRPSNRTAWLLESLADALAGLQGAPLELIMEPQLLEATQRMKQRPLTREVLPLSFEEDKKYNLEAEDLVFFVYAEAREEIALVYSCVNRSASASEALSGYFDSSCGEPGVRLLDELDQKINALRKFRGR